MTKFAYSAKTSDKKPRIIKGEMESNSRQAVIKRLESKDLKPVSIREAKKGGSLNDLFGGGKVKPDELVIFTRQLSAMVSAGVPLTRSLNSLADHTESPKFKSVLQDVIAKVEEGISFADALDKHPTVFDDIYSNMVRAGETAGILDDILKRLALQQEKSASVRKKIKSAMAYPIVLMVITVAAFFGLMIFVIPKIGGIVKSLGGPNAEMPKLTQAMLDISDALIDYWYIIFPLLIGGVFLLLRYLKTPSGKKIFHKLTLKTPAIKGIIVKVSVSRFARTYASLIGAGVPVQEALNVTSKAVGNIIYEEAVADARDKVKEGESLSSVLEKYDTLFPAVLTQMVSVGEETGQTDSVLIKVADFYEEEVDVAIDGISSIIEPAMILVMGSMVGLIAASVMGPIAGLANQIQ